MAWSDADGVRRYVELTNAVRRADSPWVHPMTVHEATGSLRHGWDGEPGLAFVASVAGTDVAVGEYSVSSYDNLHLAWLGVDVHPDLRRHGHGSALLARLTDRARTDGKTSVGIGGWEAESTRAFAAHHGLDQRSSDMMRRQRPGDLDHAALASLYDDARLRAADYDLERSPVPTPPDRLGEMAEMASAINDAPTDDLDVEDEVFSAERLAAFESAQAGRGKAVLRLVVRHRETGRLAGQTVVTVDGERPHLAEQEDTTVVAAHRGHRLGLLLKLEMLRWLADDQPQIEVVDTWNAESNEHMIEINELLGYQVVGRALLHQRSL